MADNVEARLDALESEVAELRKMITEGKGKGGWRNIVGTFENDPYYEEAMKYGREYRESLKPTKPKKKKKKSGSS